MGTPQERMGAWLKIDALFAPPHSQPVMWMEADAGRERQVGTHADEHAAPALIVDVEVVLHHPPLRDLQMPAILLLVPDGDHDAGGLAALHNRDHRVRLRFRKYGSRSLSRRSSGASRIGAPHFCERLMAQFWNWLAISRTTFPLDRY